MSNVEQFSLRRRRPEEGDLRGGGGGGISDGMDAVWKKLEEHDGRLDRIERGISHLPTQTQLTWGSIVFFVSFVGAMVATVLGVGSYMSGTMSTALSAIQTVLAAKSAETAQQPTVIVVPQQRVRPIEPTK